MKFEEAIDKFRQSEEVESVLVLLGKDVPQVNLRKVALAWPKVPVKRLPVQGVVDGPGMWDKLWESVEIDMERIGSISDTRKEASRYVGILKGYRLIYPDGTLAGVAQKALRGLAKAELGL